MKTCLLVLAFLASTSSFAKELVITIDDFLLPQVRNNYLEISSNKAFRPHGMMDIYSSSDFVLLVSIVRGTRESFLLEIPIEGWEEGYATPIGIRETIDVNQINDALNSFSEPRGNRPDYLRFTLSEADSLSWDYLDQTDILLDTFFSEDSVLKKKKKLTGYRLSNLTHLNSKEIILNFSVMKNE